MTALIHMVGMWVGALKSRVHIHPTEATPNIVLLASYCRHLLLYDEVVIPAAFLKAATAVTLKLAATIVVQIDRNRKSTHSLI